MTTVVIIPGGFHPYHAGHYALYQSAQRAFPGAEVYVAATDDRSQRPFPFKIKEKLATLAGVEPGHFVQVKSPFRADEITSRFDPEKDNLIFVRSTKDAKQAPHAGGVLKSGKPAYLQPLLGAKKLDTFNRHAYMAYLPTVEFGPGITSASEIRAAWPDLDERRKAAMVMSLYPKTQGNAKLAATVVKLLDTAIGSGVEEDISRRGFLRGLGAAAVTGAAGSALAQSRPRDASAELMSMTRDDPRIQRNADINELTKKIYARMVAERGQPMDRRQQQMWLEIARVHAEKQLATKSPGQPTAAPARQSGFPSQPSEYRRSRNIDNFEENTIGYIQEENPDYIEEKWSQKYKRSINCSNPRGFSQRAHCAGRKK